MTAVVLLFLAMVTLFVNLRPHVGIFIFVCMVFTIFFKNE